MILTDEQPAGQQAGTTRKEKRMATKHVDLPAEAKTHMPTHIDNFSIFGAASVAHADWLFSIAYTVQCCLSVHFDGPPIRLSRGVHRVATELRDGRGRWRRLVATSRPHESIWCVYVDGSLVGWVDLHNNCVYAA